MSDTSKSLRKAADEIENEGHLGWGNTCRWAADEFDALAARLAEAERLLGRIDNADAIVIDREYPAAAVDEAERIYDDLHEFLTRAADSASVEGEK